MWVARSTPAPAALPRAASTGRAGKNHVVDAATGTIQEVTRGTVAEWVEDSTLIITSG